MHYGLHDICVLLATYAVQYSTAVQHCSTERALLTARTGLQGGTHASLLVDRTSAERKYVCASAN